MSHPYRSFVDAIISVIDSGKHLPCGGFPSISAPSDPGSYRVLVFAPHPDDECIIGALPLRLQREANARVGVVAVTQGSHAARRTPRLQEMRGACCFLGWDLIITKEGGLLKISQESRDSASTLWQDAIGIIADILRRERPRVLFFPHEKDWNQAHIGTHFLVMDALRTLGPDFHCTVIETEFWASNAEPNLMVESRSQDVADLVAAISFHVGEVTRNPYHLTLPAWIADNVRRGGELVGGQGGVAPDFHFATLYRLRTWNGQNLSDAIRGGRIFAADADLSEFFGRFHGSHHPSRSEQGCALDRADRR